MIKTPLSTMIGGAGIWTPGCTILGGQQNINQLIKSLFSDGTQGLYLNAQDAVSVSDLSSIKDLSGRNNHAEQPNATSRATLITDPSGYKSLKFDGIDDGYVTQSIDFTGTDKVTVIAAVMKLSDAKAGALVELSVNASTTQGAFGLNAPDGNGSQDYLVRLRGIYDNYKKIMVSASPISSLITARLDAQKTTVDEKINIRLNGLASVVPASGTPSPPQNFGNYPLYIGRRGGTTLPFNGQIYALLVIGKLLDDATIQRIEKEFAKYIGVTL